MRREFKNIARVVRAHGRNGEVLVQPLRGLPFLLREGESYCLTPPALKRDRTSCVRQMREVADGMLVSFSKIDTISAAEDIVGCYVLADASGIELGPLDAPYDSLIGREVQDVQLGFIGTVSEIMESPAHDIWVVEGPYGEVLVPVVEAVVAKIPDAGAVPVCLPSGLIEMGE